ncbi:3-phosphoshikimate 1-carboxyvinyltransferase [Acetivibrio saccincola]|uniref:3-phosphoshikimate 1-carboxyvinyltransferase n=1 Tax=Acetivibrio saccincola TaxID=1677857 RepID=A0A2K9EDT9_9FIRM|nr:3-phosphoshikimate 1-carboxyvinyltransferase [Acetivibrio saccincola]AUG58304.1 3-phosphoshikimate 1-carboxyvinyltransferase [Acetivibrio saccincola]NLW27935.1 3-phosphoshikimate 1-carboxyvinyltransferase [Acetivibrio saccincola]PQQ68184.1 3-phosphoshikimate 1-carboxyvinyltransferase [Acetivibrio saccincola]
MILKVRKSSTSGRVKIPGSKSHTIRGLFFASLAKGKSEIKNPLISGDAESAIETCKALGAKIQMLGDKYVIEGFNGEPSTPCDVINVGNSGTTLRFGTVTAALAEGYSVFTGDYQIRKRPLGALLKAVNNLGGQALSTRNNDMAPVIVKGKIKGGFTDLDSITSQYLSALLINAPLFEKDTEINITRLNEIPYVDITLWWLDKFGIKYENNNYKSFYIKGGQRYNAIDATIPGDFSSATFFAVQAAISGGEFTLENLDINDPQGDKEVFSILGDMGASVKVEDGSITIKGNGLKGREIDMNAIPDALPAMAVAACFAEGVTKLVNVPQARLKETDRIKVMCEELSKMGADIKELEDGLVIKRSNLKGCRLKGYDDHRIVMALSLAGLNAEGETTIDTAEAIKVTFPEYVELMKNSGADMDFVAE